MKRPTLKVSDENAHGGAEYEVAEDDGDNGEGHAEDGQQQVGDS